MFKYTLKLQLSYVIPGVVAYSYFKTSSGFSCKVVLQQ
jgi:hypothetical protein